MSRIELSLQAEKFLKSLPARHGRQIAEHLLALRTDPDGTDSVESKGYSPYRRTGSGEYRIVYYIEGNVARVALVGKGNDDDIYKQLQRLLK